MTLSVIICTHNRARLLRNTLHSLERMDFPENGNLELTVVNNASTDTTASVIEEFSQTSKRFSLKALNEPVLGKTHALNTGITSSSGDVLSFVDDDQIVHERYFSALLDAVRDNPGVSLFCGRLIPNWDGTEPKWIHDTRFPIIPFPLPHFDCGDCSTEVVLQKGMFLPAGGNLAVRRSVFQRIGLFSEHLGPKGHNLVGGEDKEFVLRALKNGERLLYVPEIVQYHHVDHARLTLPYLVKKAYLRSMAAYEVSESNEMKIGNIPIYLFNQAFSRFIKALCTKSQNARRYYLIRLAAVLGEIQGRRRAQKKNSWANEK